MASEQPNILLIVSDEERRNPWLEGVVDMPAHDRLRRDGLDFNRYYTHASPCSPSRASLYTGSYLAEHGVVDNVSFPAHTALSPAIPTVGRLMREVGYESAYLGKYHLTHEPMPDMGAFGYSGWHWRRPPLRRWAVDRSALRPGDRRPGGGLVAEPTVPIPPSAPGS